MHSLDEGHFQRVFILLLLIGSMQLLGKNEKKLQFCNVLKLEKLVLII